MLCNTGVEHSPHICWNSNHGHFSISFGNDPRLKAQLLLWIVLLSVLNKSVKLLRKKQWKKKKKKQLCGGNKLLCQACWLKSILFCYEGRDYFYSCFFHVLWPMHYLLLSECLPVTWFPWLGRKLSDSFSILWNPWQRDGNCTVLLQMHLHNHFFWHSPALLLHLGTQH